VRTRALVVVAAFAALAGCTPLHRSRPGAEGWTRGVKRVGILSAIRVVEVLPGDVEELHDQWTEQASANVVAAVGDRLRARGFAPKPMSWKGNEDLDEVRLLYAEVAEAIWRYAFPPYAFPHKVERFEYGVGPIGKILDRAGADVLLVAAGGDRAGSDGRKFSALAGSRSWAILTLGLVDREGHVVWFDVRGGAALDLRSAPDVQASVEEMLAELPGATR
jgi:hypothetical protein